MKDRFFQIECENKETRASIGLLSEAGGVSEYRIRVTLPGKSKPEPVRFVWHEKMKDVVAVWHPSCGRDHAVRQWFNKTVNRSCFQSGAPVLEAVGDRGRNAFLAALSDPVTPVELAFWVEDLEQKYEVGFSVTLFAGDTDALSSYEAILRIDERKIPYYQAIRETVPFWAEAGYAVPLPPEGSEDALYSSWYNFHQAPESGKLLRELEIASSLGFRTLILDDGWQFAGPSSGNYALCGEWKMDPEKFPDFKGFVGKAHALGMRVMVWFAVPFVGKDSPLFENFRGKYLFVAGDPFEAGVLDVRFPEVREYIRSAYKRFLREYDIDGFKLDFIDAFRPEKDTQPYDPLRMDAETVGAAVEKLLLEIREELGAIKPGLLFEYRQNYVGPAVNRFGNMLRVGDCAYDSVTNRIGIADIRLQGYPVAPHADMLYWSPEEEPALYRRQLLNILFAVPQISVHLEESTEEQKACLKSYLAYWTENRDALLHGEFRPYAPEANYSLIESEGENKTIAVLHGAREYAWKGKALDLFLDADEDGLFFENTGDRPLSASVFAGFAERMNGEETIPPHAAVKLPLPRMGLLHVEEIP